MKSDPAISWNGDTASGDAATAADASKPTDDLNKVKAVILEFTCDVIWTVVR